MRDFQAQAPAKFSAAAKSSMSAAPKK